MKKINYESNFYTDKIVQNNLNRKKIYNIK